MTVFETIKSAVLSNCTGLKHKIFDQNTLTVYDVLRPVFYCSLPFGMTQFDVLVEKKFKNLPWIMIWNGGIVAVASVLAVIALTSRTFESSVGIIYNITDVAQAWVSVINIDIIIIFGWIFKNKVVYILKD